jgi:hypothetical protein
VDGVDEYDGVMMLVNHLMRAECGHEGEAGAEILGWTIPDDVHSFDAAIERAVAATARGANMPTNSVSTCTRKADRPSAGRGGGRTDPVSSAASCRRRSLSDHDHRTPVPPVGPSSQMCPERHERAVSEPGGDMLFTLVAQSPYVEIYRHA